MEQKEVFSGYRSGSARLGSNKPNINLFVSESAKDDYIWEFKRFRSFAKWPYRVKSTCTATVMAAAGWYCTSADPKDPSAKCAFCLKELSGWEITDDPWKEHQKHSGTCPFLRLKKEEKDFTVKDICKMAEARKSKILEKECEEKVRILEEQREKVLKLIKTIGTKQRKQEE